jgi:hypothetical protein
VRKALAALAVIFLAAHLPSLPVTLDDLDGINFALGVREFDVTRHQPHPPGYPIYIALAKVSTRVMTALGVEGAATRGLAIWSVLGGVLLIPGLFALFRALDGSVRHAWWATLLAITAPLVWFSALRPLSDVPGLAAAVIAQAMLVRSITSGPSRRYLLGGALLAGLAIGIRSQNFTLTLPLLGLALALPGVTSGWRTRLETMAAFAVGVLAWAVPLLIASGGLAAYLAALGQQGGEDFSGVVMLWNFPTVKVALSALQHTFISPWAKLFLAVPVLLAAAAGAAVVLLQERRVALMVVAIAVPYALFHLLFHETVTVRYALPLVPVMAWLAVRGISRFATPVMPLAVGTLITLALVVTLSASTHYGRTDTPIFLAVSDLAAARQQGPVIAASHRRLFTESRRARMWLKEEPSSWLRAPRDFEWLELTQAWRSGEATVAWFFADPRRTDLALIDGRGAQVVRYEWPFDEEVFVGGARPGVFNVHKFAAPGWFLEQGWALTPESAGITTREGWMPHLRPSIGWIRRRDGPAELILGGRHLGQPGDPPVRVVVTIDGRTVLDREVSAGAFVHRVSLPAGSLSGAGTYAAIGVTTSLPGGGAAAVALEQFDVQSDGVPMFAAESGWQEPEYKPETGLSWRWMSSRGELWVRPIGRDVRLRLTAESPLKYFDRSPVLRLSLGGDEIARLSPSSDFTWEVTMPAAKLAAADGRVVIESNESFVPGGTSGGDQRNLAIRVYRLAVD